MPELSDAGVAGVIGVIGVIGEGYRGVVPGKGAVVRVCEWKSWGVWPDVPCVACCDVDCCAACCCCCCRCCSSNMDRLLVLWTGCGVSPVPYGIIGLKIGIPGVIAPYRRKHNTKTTDHDDSILFLRDKVFRRSLKIIYVSWVAHTKPEAYNSKLLKTEHPWKCSCSTK